MKQLIAFCIVITAICGCLGWLIISFGAENNFPLYFVILTGMALPIMGLSAIIIQIYRYLKYHTF